jgi:hypothetical protein
LGGFCPTYEESERRRRRRRRERRSGAVRETRNTDSNPCAEDERAALILCLTEAEKRQAHIKRVLLAIRNVNQLIVRETDPSRLIERACANLTETLGYRSAWIMAFGPDGKSLAMTAHSGFADGFDGMRRKLEK